MAMNLATLAGRLDQFVDWFIPSALTGQKDARKKARLFLISHLLGPFLGNSVPLSLYVASPHPSWDILVLAASITGFWVFPIFLRMNVRYNLLVFLSIENLIFCILWSCYFNGAVTSPTLTWVLTIPLLAFFYVGEDSRMRISLLILFAVNLATFSLVYTILPPPHNGIPIAQMQVFGLISTCAAALYVAMMAVYYAKALASQSELELEMRRHLETARDLKEAAAEAERASAAKSDFLAKISHELRTPLNAVIGYSQILLEDAEDTGDDLDVPDIKKILASGQHLLRLVNNVLDLSKLEAGHIDMYYEPISIEEIIRSTVDGLEIQNSQKGNTIQLHMNLGDARFSCDATKIQCALLNVIENAVKFTANGRIDIFCERRLDAGRSMIAIEVADTGVGIEPEELSRLFQQFSAAEDLSSAKYGGTGVGLALTRKLCRLLGGDVTVESTAGVGSRFTVLVPEMPPAVPAAGTATTVAARAEKEAGKSARTAPAKRPTPEPDGPFEPALPIMVAANG